MAEGRTMEQEATDTYRIELPQFEGPFDLLLFFIERDELDIHDIPIAQITQEFLTYMHAAKELNIELAAEFILVASTLMRIKAKMLLPRPVLNEAGEEIDPREELVRRLLEYKRYKSVLNELGELEFQQSMREVRGNIQAEEQSLLQSEFPEEELVGINLYTIMQTFKRILDKHHEQLQQPRHVIRQYPFSMDEVKERLFEELELEPRLDFVSFLLKEPELSRIFVVFSFLSVLELVQMQRLSLIVGQGFNNFWMEKKEPLPEEADDSEKN
jgi:segregation and condensation protein A